jgi:hypothetical protein
MILQMLDGIQTLRKHGTRPAPIIDPTNAVWIEANIYLRYDLPRWKRLWIAIKYVLGIRFVGEYYEPFTLRYVDIYRFNAVVGEMLARIRAYQEAVLASPGGNGHHHK